MSDLIERQEALYVLDEFQESVENGTPCYAKARVEMCNIPSAQQWIPCSERLPEDGVTVLVTIKGHDVIRCEDGETLEQAIARISKIRWVWQGFYCETDKSWCSVDGFPMMVQPVAWMPLPEPYKGEEKWTR